MRTENWQSNTRGLRLVGEEEEEGGEETRWSCCKREEKGKEEAKGHGEREKVMEGREGMQYTKGEITKQKYTTGNRTQKSVGRSRHRCCPENDVSSCLSTTSSCLSTQT